MAYRILLCFLVVFGWKNSVAQVLPENSPSRDNTFIVAEKMPEFPGGQSALVEFIKTNMRYPEKAIKLGDEGKVLVTFVVNPEGKVIDPEVKISITKELDEEAIRIVKHMPIWKPGMQNGKAVNVQLTLPILFKLVKD
jgi:TonB family protein